MSGSPTLRQNHFRYRQDGLDLEAASPVWLAAEDVDFFPGFGVPFRIRIAIDNTGTGGGVNGSAIKVSKNGGAYANITTSSSNVKAVDACSSTDGFSLSTARLTVGAGSFGTGRYHETGGGPTPKVSAGNYSEVEEALQLVATDLAPGDTLDFRIYDALSSAIGTAFTTYNVTPRITIPTAPSAPASTTQYDLSNTASGLSGASVNKKLEASGAASGTWSGQSLASQGGGAGVVSVVDGSFFTESGIPDATGIDSTKLVAVSLDITTGNANLRYGVRLARVDSSGAVQAWGPFADESTSGATGVYTSNCYATALGTWVSGDRLRLDVRIRNATTNTAQSATLTYAAAGSSWVKLPGAVVVPTFFSGGDTNAHLVRSTKIEMVGY